MRYTSSMLAVSLMLVLSTTAHADELGCVSTDIRMLGVANDKICVTSFKDEEVGGVVCHLSRAQTGGAKGAVGMAEDTSDAAISCNQVGPITVNPDMKDKQKVFKESRSLIWKTLQVIRFYDRANNELVYLTYSDKVITGSPKNAVSAVPIEPWPAASKPAGE